MDGNFHPDFFRALPFLAVDLDSRRYDTARYTLTSFPATVLAGLQQSAEYGNDIFYGTTLRDSVDVARFDTSWWYRVEAASPAIRSVANGSHFVILSFKGINYRANVWVNGIRIADNGTTRGTFREFDFDITSAVAQGGGQIVLAVEVFRPYDIGLDKNTTCRGRSVPECLDLAISWVDWAPTPPDVNMGLWRAVHLATTGPVVVQHPQVTTTLVRGGARVEVLVLLRNHHNESVTGNVSLILGDGLARCTITTAATKKTTVVTFRSTECPALLIADPPLWWPWQMGTPTLINLDIKFVPADSEFAAFELSSRVGLREIVKTIDQNGNALFRINGKRILIRGGGWAPDLLQRMVPERHTQELAYVRHLGLNAIRLEGKLQDEDLFNQVQTVP